MVIQYSWEQIACLEREVRKLGIGESQILEGRIPEDRIMSGGMKDQFQRIVRTDLDPRAEDNTHKSVHCQDLDMEAL